MIMKLELKHLAPYLAYKIKVYDTVIKKAKVMNLGQGASSNWVGLKTVLSYHNNDNFIYKPILRPLSDLTKEIEVNGEKFVPIEYLERNYSGFFFGSTPELLIKSKNTNLYISLNWAMEFQQKLFEWHLDVYGLIDKGLAVNINDIAQNIPAGTEEQGS